MGTSKILIDGVGIDLTQDTVAANKMLSGIKAHDSNGDSVTGSIPNVAGKTVVPTDTEQVAVAAGNYVSGDVKVAAIPAPVVVEEKDVLFYDYDGTLLYSWSADEVERKTALPQNPDHTHDKFYGTYKTYDVGLTSQGWNWTLEQVKQSFTDYPDGVAIIGQHYITDDGKTRLFVRLTKGQLNPCICVMLNGTCEIDWGDDSEPTILTGTSTSTRVLSPAHEYAAPGDYVISLDIVGSAGCQTSGVFSLICDGISYVYRNVLTKIEQGNNFSISNVGALVSNYNLEYVANTKTSDIYIQTFQSTNLKCYFYSETAGAFNRDQEFENCKLEVLSFPYANCNIGWNALNSATNLRHIRIPDNVANFDCINTLKSLTKFIFPLSTTVIKASLLSNMYCLTYIRFSPTTPPIVANSNAFANLPSVCILSVPLQSLQDYLTATNYPSKDSYTYIAFYKSTQSETLPTSKDSYLLTWYATTVDAKNQTNPITAGNGKEVYCRFTEV